MGTPVPPAGCFGELTYPWGSGFGDPLRDLDKPLRPVPAAIARSPLLACWLLTLLSSRVVIGQCPCPTDREASLSLASVSLAVSLPLHMTSAFAFSSLSLQTLLPTLVPRPMPALA